MRRTSELEEPSNHERWLLSYSDFMTLLFALFVVLFASSFRDNQAIKKLSKAIHVGFQSLGAFSEDPSTVSYAGFADDLTRGTPIAQQSSPRDPTASAHLGVDITGLKKQLEEAMGQEIRNHEVDVRVTPEGFVISLKDLGFFNSGEAELRPGGAEKIARIAKVLAQHKLYLRIEGHSDDMPIHTEQFRSNWELSTSRAMTVLLLLVNDAGVDPARISVAGYGQYRPIATNTTPDGRSMNRRVDLVVVGSSVTH